MQNLLDKAQLELDQRLKDLCSEKNPDRYKILACMFSGGNPFAETCISLIRLCQKGRFGLVREILIEKRDVTITNFEILISVICTCFRTDKSDKEGAYQTLALFEDFGLIYDGNDSDWMRDARSCLYHGRCEKREKLNEELKVAERRKGVSQGGQKSRRKNKGDQKRDRTLDEVVILFIFFFSRRKNWIYPKGWKRNVPLWIIFRIYF
jgi:hypothetical protein